MSGTKGFISFEGIEGSGKSTQIRAVAEHLTGRGLKVVTTAEPGGTVIGEKIRALLLDPASSMDPLTELLLYYASRAQHVREVIYPALLSDSVVLTDRFTDSTTAYQGYARGLDLMLMDALNDVVVPDLKPDMTFLLDLDVEEGLQRNRNAEKTDRFELETLEFHRRVRKGYLKLADSDPERFRVIDASRSAAAVTGDIIGIIEETWLSKILSVRNGR